MNKRDTIIIASLLNAATLAVLFMMAINSDDDTMIDPSQIPTDMIAKAPQKQPIETTWAMSDAKMYANDEVDELLREFDALSAESSPVEAPVAALETHSSPTGGQQASSLAFALPDAPTEDNLKNIVDITVKKGDSLDKIARANGTTVSDIKAINRLKTERLAIGQILKVPLDSAKNSRSQPQEPLAHAAIVNQMSHEQEPVYYTVKSGDNPWKIAKQMHIKMDDLLKLNQLNEEKARNLKVGDKIRIK